MNNEENFDFSGWATVSGVQCADGLTIMNNAFADDDGRRVPLIFMHDHKNLKNTIGHAILENRPGQGVYAYCKLADTPEAKHAGILVRDGHLNTLSIWANQLHKKGNEVIHGIIREVSLVLAGANPGAIIDCPYIAHDAMNEFDEVIYEVPVRITVNERLNIDEENLMHSIDGIEELEPEPKPIKKKIETINNKEENPMPNYNDMTVEEIIGTMNEAQQDVVFYFMGLAGEKGESEMAHDVFDDGSDYLSQDAMNEELMHSIDEAVREAATGRHGTLKDVFMAHGLEDLMVAGEEQYGIQGITSLVPEAHQLNGEPVIIDNEPTDWVAAVWSGVTKVPYGRFKTTFADITADEARAKGYTKGKLKKEEVIKLAKRATSPTTVYKKQKFDRDDVIDMDFDVIVFIKKEMDVKLREEVCRAILTGDGRTTLDEDKINEECIRPIWTDHSLFTNRHVIPMTAEMANDAKFCVALEETIIMSRTSYRGSGNKTMFCSPTLATKMSLMKDSIGRRLYPTEAELKSALRVRNIVEVPYFEDLTRVGTSDLDGDTKVHTLQAIILDLKDYTVGTDTKGERKMFEDFDIDYNQMKYLIEERRSGAMTKAYAATVIETVPAE